jgi:hypothetical protein
VTDDELADRLERMAEWHAGLRTSEQADLRHAAARLRTTPDEPVATPPAPMVHAENGS